MNKQRRKYLAEAVSKLEEAMQMVQDATDEEQDAFDNMPEGLQYSERGEQMEENISNMDDAPTVDAVPVVRCGECRWALLAPQRQTATCMKRRVPFTHEYDFFCADGERKEKERE